MKRHLTYIDEMAKAYGLYGGLITCKGSPGKLDGDSYIVLSQTPISPYLDPVELYNRLQRDPDLFYPGEFACRFDADSPLLALDESIEFMRDAEFLTALYAEFDATLPEKIRYSELAGLKSWYQLRSNPNTPEYLASQAEKGLKAFFKKEKSSFGQEKRSFFRSERFDENATFFQRQADYRQRESSIVRLPVLLQSSENLGKTLISSAYLPQFNEAMAKSFPEVIYSLSDKMVIDTGLLNYAKACSLNDDFLDSVPVTDEAFQRMLYERFASEGLSCVDGIEPAYWEYYDLYYKKADEAKIASVYNQVTQGFAQSTSLATLTERGAVRMIPIPTNSFHLFVDLARRERIPFHIDFNGVYNTPSFSEVHVVFNVKDCRTVSKIIDEMILHSWKNGHIISLRKADTMQLEEPIADDLDYESLDYSDFER